LYINMIESPVGGGGRVVGLWVSGTPNDKPASGVASLGGLKTQGQRQRGGPGRPRITRYHNHGAHDGEGGGDPAGRRSPEPPKRFVVRGCPLRTNKMVVANERKGELPVKPVFRPRLRNDIGLRSVEKGGS